MAVLFDLDGTLCGVSKSRSEILAECLERCGLPEIDRDDYLRAHDRVTIDNKLKTRFPIFKEVFEEKGVFDVDRIRRLSRIYHYEVLDNLYLFNGVDEVLDKIQDEKVLVTNGPKKVQREKVESLGLSSYFSCVVTSGEVGVAKPDPTIFKYAVEKSDCKPKAYIGNSLKHDVAGANNYGIKSILISFNGEKYRYKGLKPDYVIQNLNELKNIPEISFK
ncbi:HAD family hydrolase [Methanonatronarchaeum sp. AMET-Sl]|uniref:HAD family hydrolase n=1 Tax=Methanonatronarchaeum sp. AMET-Sl TaxID=3037654 RepID=UPI00244E012F|nr:HAD family hydrolase [Methanonatronarchaeum sp. AMET-Sl]WGI17855.1 HAD family hydrolase [Methanonatronarchaeum sp. AMET-Sl]